MTIPNSYPSLDFDLGDTADMLRDSVRSFTSDRIAPIAEEIDKSNNFPRHLWPELGALGLLRDYGRRGLRRHGSGLPRALRGDGGSEPRLGVGRPVLRRAFQSLRQPDPQERQRRAEAPLSAEAHLRRTCGRARHERDRFGLRCRLDAAARGEARQPLRAQRHQDVDHQRSACRYAGRLCQDRSRSGPARHHRVPDRKRLQGIPHGAEARQARHARLGHGRTRLRRLRSAGGERAWPRGRRRAASS